MSKKEKRPDRFYVYVYLDPRKRGRFCYPMLNQSFLYEPMYVGKGQGPRYKAHLKEPQWFKNLIHRWRKLSWAKRTKKWAKHNFFKGWNYKKIKAIHKIQKAGLNPFIEKIIENITDDEAYAYEQFVVERIGRLDLGTGCLYNKCESRGGDKIKTHPRREEIYKEMSERNKKNPTYSMLGKNHTQETKDLISSLLRGRPNLKQRGKYVSPETREKLRQANLGKTYSEEYKRKMSVACTGWKHTPESLLKMSKAQKGLKKTFKDPEAFRKIQSELNSLENNSRWMDECPTTYILHMESNGFTIAQMLNYLKMEGLTQAIISKRLKIYNRSISSKWRANPKNLCYLLQRGYTHAEIAKTLNIKEKYIKGYIERYLPEPLELYYEI